MYEVGLFVMPPDVQVGRPQVLPMNFLSTSADVGPMLVHLKMKRIFFTGTRPLVAATSNVY